MKFAKFTFFLLSLLLAMPAGRASAAPVCVQIYFDLGNTLVDTTQRDGQGEIKKIFYFPKVPNYLDALVARGYQLGLIVNVPAEWGIPGLEDYVNKRWSDQRFPHFDWARFGSNILLPSKEEFRKPNRHMFCEAARRAERSGCVAVFQGEDFTLEQSQRLQTVQAARAAGMVGVLVDRKPVNAPEQDPSERGSLLAPEEVDGYIQAHPPVKAPGYCGGIDSRL